MPTAPPPLQLAYDDERTSVDSAELGFLRAHPSAALPPSPFSPESYSAVDRPRAPTPRAAGHDQLWSPTSDMANSPRDSSSHWDPNTGHMTSPLSPNVPFPPPRLDSLYAASDEPIPSPPPQATAANSNRLKGLPDPAQFPDPYPTRAQPPGGSRSHPPSLVSSLGDSSSGSARSSAYTSWGAALAAGEDNVHVHVATSSDENDGSTIPAPILRARPSKPSLLPPTPSSPPSRSRASSIAHNNGGGTLRRMPSYDASWQAAVNTQDDDTDIETDEDDMHDDDDDDDIDDRTAAVVVAEQGRGLIVRAEGKPIVQIQVQPGTTHLLVGSSTTPNAVPSFLAINLAQTSHSLLALDISANFLVALPPALASCHNLEELNIGSNPLRVLPVFLAHLTSLRVLIADSTGTSALPEQLAALDKLHTLSIRKNKFMSLPGWLSLLASLQTLLVDQNPFQGPWKALLDPLTSKEVATPAGMTPLFTPATPSAFPFSTATSETDENDDSGDDDITRMQPRARTRALTSGGADEDDTILPSLRAQSGLASPEILDDRASIRSGGSNLSRSKTAGGRLARSRADSKPRAGDGGTVGRSSSRPSTGNRPEIRKMKSAGELRETFAPEPPPFFPPPSPNPGGGGSGSNSGTGTPIMPSPAPRPGMPHYAASTIGVPALQVDVHEPGMRIGAKFATMGPAGLMSPDGVRTPARSTMHSAFWDNISDEAGGSGGSTPISPPRSPAPPPVPGSPGPGGGGRNEKDKSKWSFLKKMSMSRMKPEGSPPQMRPTTSGGNGATPRPMMRPRGSTQGAGTLPRIHEPPPQVDIRMSAMAPLDVSAAVALTKKQSRELLRSSPSIAKLAPMTLTNPDSLRPPGSGAPPGPGQGAGVGLGLGLPSGLAPPPTPRSARRRSFLPLDGPPALTIPIPPPPPFAGLRVSDASTLDSPDHDQDRAETPSPLYPRSGDAEAQMWVEQERVREVYARALKAVMNYLRDMHDLGLSSGQPMAPLSDSLRARRPTMAEMGRQTSEHSMLSMASSSTNTSSMFSASTIGTTASVFSNASTTTGTSSVISSGSDGNNPLPSHLRGMTSNHALRSGQNSQTASVATTDSAGSMPEERVFKDDKGKRAMIVREIVETERTYVKGLQELVEIYIAPASVPVSNLTGPKLETVVPAQERKVVFGSLEMLFQFHKASFLPALETAVAPMLKAGSNLAEADVDGRLSLATTMAVANTFVSHAAFMKMYSTYINNFDNAVQRIKSWTSDRPPTAPGTPALGGGPGPNGQIGLGIAMTAAAVSGVQPENASMHAARLTSSQKRRIKQWMKRCRTNPRHSQLNMEGYLLLPVQRIPRYRLLLEELVRSTPPTGGYHEDPLDRALSEIASLANNMNEGKRESESRSKLVKWQARIRGSSKFPSPLVQPHRRLIMDGRLMLTRVVRKAVASYEVVNPAGDTSQVQVECLQPEVNPRSLIGVLCNDLLVLCRDPSDGRDPAAQVDLWAVLRMQTVAQPASIMHENVLRIVDNKAVLYFTAPTAAEAINWYRAINTHIPSSKT